MRSRHLTLAITAVGALLTVRCAAAQDCLVAVNAALADNSLSVLSVSPEGVRIALQGDLASEADPGKLTALVNNIECALTGPGGQIKKLELVSPNQQVVARETGGQVEILAKAPR